MGECEGFSNYATAGVVMTLDNDRAHANWMHRLTFGVIDTAPNSENVAESIWTVEEAERFILADLIKDYVERRVEDGQPSLMAAQMAQAGLCEVNWDEIARNYLSLAKNEWER